MEEADLLTGKPVEATVPFALWLLSPYARAQAAALYSFARGVDDLADDPVMNTEEKRKQLLAIRHALQSGEQQGVPVWARGFAQLQRRKLVKLSLTMDLLNAMEDDVEHRPIRDYEALLAYARLAAVPVGRLALEVVNEPQADLAASDALCIALQLLNVVRDASKDYLVLGRVYLPGDWLRQGGVPMDDLTHTQMTPRLRGAMQRVLDRAAAFLDAARPLPSSVQSRRLRVMLRSVMIMARMLLQKLKTENPLAGRIHLTRWEQAQAIWQAALIEYLPKSQAKHPEKIESEQPASEEALLPAAEDMPH